MAHESDSRLRCLPSVSRVLSAPEVQRYVVSLGHPAVTRVVRETIGRYRDSALAAPLGDGRRVLSAVVEEVVRALAGQGKVSLSTVVNGTGVLLHTNLGRAPLSRAALSQLVEIASGYCTLELDRATRKRGSRHQHVEPLLAELCGAEGSLAVNNNAAAVWLVLRALAAGRKVVVSRGELVEIGGGFRIPDILRDAGVELVEVGTTNRTRIEDYAAACSADALMILRVHRSNFEMVGFTEMPSLAALANLARERGLQLVVDQGSGALVDLPAAGIQGEQTVKGAIAAKADLVCFSGDKLLGGPQAGLIVGKADLIARIAQHPMMRALRPGKLELAALEATLRAHRSGAAGDEIPFHMMLHEPLSEVRARADRLAAGIVGLGAGWSADVRPTQNRIGGGAAPTALIEGYGVFLSRLEWSADDLAQAFAGLHPSVIGRIEDDRLVVEARTLLVGDVEVTLQAMRAIA
ncbi:MAG: L-seryl-tRNA(Sec) selenium transferase [Deltaproteobacteria bacterium]|nr:L-seryl-tRNA(Sec) selenium transferase [Deltaproteobacteria bacterium]